MLLLAPALGVAGPRHWPRPGTVIEVALESAGETVGELHSSCGPVVLHVKKYSSFLFVVEKLDFVSLHWEESHEPRHHRQVQPKLESTS